MISTVTEQKQPQSNFLWDAQNLIQATQGVWNINTDITSRCICTDTRNIKNGDIFLAIKGDNFDGHGYLEKAKLLGAVACVVSTLQDIDIPQLLVTDTKLALGDLGRFVRQEHTDLKVVALTGSSGKTTTKEMLGSILNLQAPTLVTRGNLNNDLGVPMMLLELTKEQRFAVLELGANHVGEIAYTTAMVQPDVACVLNIGTAHLGEFGGRKNICLAKAEIFEGLTASKYAVVPTHDDYAHTLKAKACEYTDNINIFGTDITAEEVKISAYGSTFTLVFNDQEKHSVSLSFAGKHNVTNALAAASCAYSIGISPEKIAQGLTQAVAPQGRLNHITFNEHVLIDDTYNANPDATLAAADVLVQTAAESPHKALSIMVLGDIGELGESAIQEHQKLGDALAQKHIDHLYCVGDLMTHCAQTANKAGLQTQHFSSKEALITTLKVQLEKNQHVVALFKGSRFMAMETLIQDITQT